MGAGGLTCSPCLPLCPLTPECLSPPAPLPCSLSWSLALLWSLPRYCLSFLLLCPLLHCIVSPMILPLNCVVSPRFLPHTVCSPLCYPLHYGMSPKFLSHPVLCGLPCLPPPQCSLFCASSPPHAVWSHVQSLLILLLSFAACPVPCYTSPKQGAEKWLLWSWPWSS